MTRGNKKRKGTCTSNSAPGSDVEAQLRRVSKPATKKKKRAGSTRLGAAAAPAAAAAAAASTDRGNASKLVTIEAYRAGGIFANKAQKLEKAIKKAVPDAVVEINASAPRKGAFVVTTTTGAGMWTHVELFQVQPPYLRVKALDVKQLAADIAGALSGQ